MTCPACGTDAAVLITNIGNGAQFCHRCAHQECPSFLQNYVLTREDVLFIRACGIDPEISRIIEPKETEETPREVIN